MDSLKSPFVADLKLDTILLIGFVIKARIIASDPIIIKMETAPEAGLLSMQ
jgi:hypothetical protein